MFWANAKFIEIRKKFENLYKINVSFQAFIPQVLFIYLMSMEGKSIMKLVGRFCHDILKLFDSLTNV